MIKQKIRKPNLTKKLVIWTKVKISIVPTTLVQVTNNPPYQIIWKHV